MKSIVTAEDVWQVPEGGVVRASAGAVVTEWAREVAATRGVRIALGDEVDAPADDVIAIGGDHGGFELKEALKAVLTRLGRRFRDLGTFSKDPVDYPDVAAAVARAVRRGEARMGIVVDGAGIGSAIAANKLTGIRAATCNDAAAARNAREHNDANVLSLGARFVGEHELGEIVEVFLTARCSEDRHRRRVRKIERLEGER
jgi:ribose 5-phosphate isomerase B